MIARHDLFGLKILRIIAHSKDLRIFLKMRNKGTFVTNFLKREDNFVTRIDFRYVYFCLKSVRFKRKWFA